MNEVYCQEGKWQWQTLIKDMELYTNGATSSESAGAAASTAAAAEEDEEMDDVVGLASRLSLR